MCARYTLSTPSGTLAELFGFDPPINLLPRYNMAPTQNIPAVRLNSDNRRELAMLRWGLIPAWASDPAVGAKHLNARSETVGEKPSFRDAVRHRRCIIPADGFYEWKTTAAGKKQPYLIQRTQPGIVAFAGIWDRWVGPDCTAIESCSILTVAANELLLPLHERMPLILEPAGFARWLDRRITRVEELQPMMRTLPKESLHLYPVNPKVNNARFDDPVCTERIEEVEPTERQLTLW